MRSEPLIQYINIRLCSSLSLWHDVECGPVEPRAGESCRAGELESWRATSTSTSTRRRVDYLVDLDYGLERLDIGVSCDLVYLYS